jgi:hypothetical protein
LTPKYNPGPSSLKSEPRTENSFLAAPFNQDVDHLADNALEPHSRTAIEAFQINATLSSSTLDPELAEQLGLETADATNAR